MRKFFMGRGEDEEEGEGKREGKEGVNFLDKGNNNNTNLLFIICV